MINKSKLLRDNSKTAVFCFEPGVAENTTDVDIVNGARPSFMDMHSPDIKRVKNKYHKMEKYHRMETKKKEEERPDAGFMQCLARNAPARRHTAFQLSALIIRV
ncbi:hypothetical protein RB195_008193 [Necator americanus]|uniref:Uncharacterized protein n=1 Tax=Necator americanus TaxID=51031 RepID=A0ABR1CMF8_NECAM